MVKPLAVKKFGKFGKSQSIRQSFFTNIHDKVRDHTICVAELTRKLNTPLNTYVATRYLMKESVSF